MVIDVLRLLFQQCGPRVLLVLDDLRKHFFQSLNDSALRFTKRHLIGNLEYITERFSPLAVKAAHRETKLVHRLNNWIDLLRQYQTRQVEHGADSDTGADVGGTGSEVAEIGIESVLESFLQVRV